MELFTLTSLNQGCNVPTNFNKTLQMTAWKSVQCSLNLFMAINGQTDGANLKGLFVQHLVKENIKKITNRMERQEENERGDVNKARKNQRRKQRSQKHKPSEHRTQWAWAVCTWTTSPWVCLPEVEFAERIILHSILMAAIGSQALSLYNRRSCYHDNSKFFVCSTFHRLVLFIGLKCQQRRRDCRSTIKLRIKTT